MGSRVHTQKQEVLLGKCLGLTRKWPESLWHTVIDLKALIGLSNLVKFVYRHRDCECVGIVLAR